LHKQRHRTPGWPLIHRLHPLDLWKAAAFRAYEDPQGSVWIASSIGLYRVTGDLLETPAPGLHARFFFAGKDGELWVGTNGRGLVHLKRRVARMFTRADGLQNEITMAVLSTHDGKSGPAVIAASLFSTAQNSNPSMSRTGCSTPAYGAWRRIRTAICGSEPGRWTFPVQGRAFCPIFHRTRTRQQNRFPNHRGSRRFSLDRHS